MPIEINGERGWFAMQMRHGCLQMCNILCGVNFGLFLELLEHLIEFLLVF
jgi:hypothetical protein